MTALWGLLKGSLAGVWGYLAAAGGMILAILVVLFQAKKAGKNEVIVEATKKELEDVKKAAEVERDVAVTKPDDVRERLRKYQRD